jgi:hypothetical protein
MDARDRRRTHLRHALAGIQAGIVGAFLMILWSAGGSLRSRRSFWTIPNLYATTFYGSQVYVNGFTRGSWTGLAAMLFICGLGGMIWGVIWRDDRKPFMTLYGAIGGLLVYYVLFDLILRHTSPLVPLYAPEPQMQIGYLLWGIALSRSPVYSRRVASAMGLEDTGSPGAEPIRSGVLEP